MAKMDKKWIILCSTAVAAVYSTGYISTEAQAVKMDVQQQAQIAIHSKMEQPSMNVAMSTANTADKSNLNSANKVTENKSKPTVLKDTKPKLKYKNGTFNGMGMNRRGSIEVAVTLKNDKITDVEISNWGMHYSESDIVGMPEEVVHKQTAQVDIVSGATFSSMAFADAVQDALNHAFNA